ncbi:MAG: phosphoribosylformylglycinamidine synthase subunit PurQ [Crocinitomicaceae bacterium]|nr:phosphoribosylformylglycinamidine synthase subunit PurQ [Crocinitomicaceae bacterium]
MKFGVVVFPESNCDQDILYTLTEILHQEAVPIWHKEQDLQGCDFIFLSGGISDDGSLGNGAISRLSPVMSAVGEHAKKGGYIMGISKGFQALCEAGLLPGTLLQNESGRFICKNIFIKAGAVNTIVTSGLDSQKAYKIPIAHSKGRYFASPDVLKSIEDNDQVIFRYCNEKGEYMESANPNGSLANIAGIISKEKNVIGMMPHPERAADFELENLDGRELFDSILAVINA